MVVFLTVSFLNLSFCFASVCPFSITAGPLFSVVFFCLSPSSSFSLLDIDPRRTDIPYFRGHVNIWQ